MRHFVEHVVDVASAFQRLYLFLDSRGVKLIPVYDRDMNDPKVFLHHEIAYISRLENLEIWCGMDLRTATMHDRPKDIREEDEEEEGVWGVGFNIATPNAVGSETDFTIDIDFKPEDKLWEIGFDANQLPKELQAILGNVNEEELTETEAFELIGAFTDYFISQRPTN